MKIKVKPFHMDALVMDVLDEGFYIDLLLMAVTSERRSYRVLDILRENDKVEKSILFNYKKLRPSVRDGDSIYYKYLEMDRIIYVDCEIDDTCLEFISRYPVDSCNTIGVDITGFCIPDIYRIFFVLKEVLKVERIIAFYTEPKQYISDFSILADEKTASEIKILPIKEFFKSPTNQEEGFICFLGFDKAIADHVHTETNPYMTIVVNGFPSYLPKLKDFSIVNNSALIDKLAPEAVRYAQANDPFASYNLLCEIKDSHCDLCITICTLGSKPMALGACLFALDNFESIRVIYPYPKQIPNKYSEEVGMSWCYVLE